MISEATQTFYALTGAGAYTGGLLPHHCVRLWKVYCIPHMLYGVAVIKLNQAVRNKLDRAQHQLFKKILGLPNTAADEAVHLLTGLIPLSMQVDLEMLLLMASLPTYHIPDI